MYVKRITKFIVNMRMAYSKGWVVTPIGPVLTSATAVKMQSSGKIGAVKQSRL